MAVERDRDFADTAACDDRRVDIAGTLVGMAECGHRMELSVDLVDILDRLHEEACAEAFLRLDDVVKRLRLAEQSELPGFEQSDQAH